MTDQLGGRTYEEIEEDKWLDDHLAKLTRRTVAIPREKWTAIYEHRKANFPLYLIQSDDKPDAFIHLGYWIVPL